MSKALKIAFVSPVWTTWQHRLMAGALRYADTHGRVMIRGFAPVPDLAAVVQELQSWGTRGIMGFMEHADAVSFLSQLSQPIPMVNNALAMEHPNVVTVVADFQAFVRQAVDHFRHLGVRHAAMLVLEDGPQIQKHLVEQFLRIVQPAKPGMACLVCPVEREKLWNAHAPVKPVPALLAEWLRILPKPTGILAPELGGGGYLIRCCQALGLRVPEDIAVIGGDDTDLSLAVEPTLTSMLPALETMGFEALRVLVDLIAGKRPPGSIVRLDCVELHVRESTGLHRSEICDIGAALQAIRDHACRGITVGQVIKQTQKVSKVTFHRRFQEVVGKSPAEVIRERKLDEVRRLLVATDLPLTMVSDLCGFSSAKVLARVFRAEEGTTPRDFRKARRPAKTATPV